MKTKTTIKCPSCNATLNLRLFTPHVGKPYWCGLAGDHTYECQIKVLTTFPELSGLATDNLDEFIKQFALRAAYNSF